MTGGEPEEQEEAETQGKPKEEEKEHMMRGVELVEVVQGVCQMEHGQKRGSNDQGKEEENNGDKRVEPGENGKMVVSGFDGVAKVCSVRGDH